MAGFLASLETIQIQPGGSRQKNIQRSVLSPPVRHEGVRFHSVELLPLASGRRAILRHLRGCGALQLDSCGNEIRLPVSNRVATNEFP